MYWRDKDSNYVYICSIPHLDLKCKTTSFHCRGKEGENVDGMFMEKADSIVKKHFKDFGDFQATWLVKVTWENMTLYGHKDKVKLF